MNLENMVTQPTFTIRLVLNFCFVFVFFHLKREKKKEKERDELWKRLSKLELDSKNKSTSSVSSPAGSSLSISTSSGSGSATKSWASGQTFSDILICVTVFLQHSVHQCLKEIINFQFEEVELRLATRSSRKHERIY